MDFHSLTRRQLQALCKKNSIPANLTNLAMALSLQALPTVQGVEELLLQQASSSSTESPPKSQVASLSVPRTATSRRKATLSVEEDESEPALHPSTRTRRSSRRLAVAAAAGGDVPHTPLQPNKQTEAASVCRKMETHFDEIEQEEHQEEEEEDNNSNIGKGSKHLSEIPPALPASRQRGLKHTHGYSTRRSTRLAQKNMEDFVTSKEEEDVKEGSKSLTTGLFSDGFGEIMEMNQQRQQECPAAADSLPVTESPSAVDLKEKSEVGLLDSYKPEVLSGGKPGCSVENHVNFPIQCYAHGGEAFEIGDSKMIAECDNGSNEIYCNETEDAFKNGEELDINDEMGCNNVAAEDVAQVIDTNDVCIIGDVTDLKMKSEEELPEPSKEFGSSEKTNASFDGENRKKLNEAKEVESEDAAAQSLVDEGKDLRSDDLDAALNINDGVVESNESGEQAVGITPAAEESMVEMSAFADDLVEKLVAMELETSAADGFSEMSWVEAAADVRVEPPCTAEEECGRSMPGYNVANLEIIDEDAQEEEELKNYDHATGDDLLLAANVVLPRISITAEPNENLGKVVVQTSSSTSTPMKEESATPSKTTAAQLKKSVTKKTPRQVTMAAAHVSDDKENISIHNSGTKLITAEEKKGKKQSCCQENSEKPLDEQSLRQLTKMLKEKLEITKKMSMTKDSSKAAPTESGRRRLALQQTLSENQLE